MPSSNQHQLIRGLGPIAAISVNVGNIIGTGIFLKARVMTCNVGTPLRVIAVWVAAGLLALAGALTYAELTTMRPEAGAEYVITRDAYGRVWGFLNGWSQFLISRTASAAALSVGFAIFMNDLLNHRLSGVYFSFALPGGYQIPFGKLQVVALLTLGVTTLINCAAVSVSGHVASFITLLKVLLVLGVGVGAFFYQDGSWAHLTMSNLGGTCEKVAVTGGGFSGFAAAMLGALWAYDGWNNVSYVAGEVKRPERNLPLALISSMFIVMALYVLVNVSYYYVLTPTQIASVSPASSVAAEATLRVLGPLAVSLIAAIMLLSSWGSLQTSILGTARIPFAMARDGIFFESLARVSRKTHVPVISLIVQAVWAGILTLSGTFDQLTDFAIFAFWLFYGMVAASVFVFRFREPDAPRPYRTWGYPVVPAIFVLVTIYLIVFTIKNAPVQSLIGLAIIATGLPVYWYFAKSFHKLLLTGGGALGLLFGGFVGFLLRPTDPVLKSQLPFSAVLTRGSDLAGSAQALVPLAKTSFNYMLALGLVGAIFGIILGHLLARQRTSPPSA
jgi:APA family basic amino acid/polyamine antiporter